MYTVCCPLWLSCTSLTCLNIERHGLESQLCCFVAMEFGVSHWKSQILSLLICKMQIIIALTKTLKIKWNNVWILQSVWCVIKIHMHAFCYDDDDFAIDPSNICSSKALANFTVSLRWIKYDLYYLQEHSLDNISTSKHIQRTLQGNSWNCCSTQGLKWECFAKRWIRFPLSVHLQNLFFCFLFFFSESLQAKRGQCFCKTNFAHHTCCSVSPGKKAIWN